MAERAKGHRRLLRQSRIACWSFRPAHVGAGSLERADVETGQADLWPSGRRFEFGTRASTLYAGLGYSIAWLESLGWDNITAHITKLSDYLKARIQERPYLHLLTPLPFEQSSGLTTFVMDDWNAGELSRELFQRSRIRVRVIPHYNATRISTAHFNNEADVDILIKTLDEIAAKTSDRQALATAQHDSFLEGQPLSTGLQIAPQQTRPTTKPEEAS